MPNHAERRVASYQVHRELPFASVMAVIDLLILSVVGLFGSTTPLGGWGGGIAFFAGAALFTYLYGMGNTRGRYDVQTGVGLLGGILFVLANGFLGFPFGTALYETLWNGNDITGQIGFAIVLLSLLVLLVEGYVTTKRTDIV